MPPPRQYPGLGPLPEALGMSPSAPASQGVRDEGMALLQQMFTPPTLQEEEYRRLREHYMGPMRRSVEEAMGAPKPKSTVPERMNEARQTTESAYYGVPIDAQGVPLPSGAQTAYDIASQRPENKLGSSASGQATPAPTDARMGELMTNALTGFGVGMIGRGLASAGEPLQQIISTMLRSRRTPESVATQMRREEEARRGQTVEGLAAEAALGANKGAKYTVQQFNPPEGYPMNVYETGPGTPGYNMPRLPFYFQ